MANPEHLKILKQGVEVWNKWREDNPIITHPDLSEAKLSDLNLSKANLGGADLYNADLFGADLSEVNLGYAELGKGNLLSVNLMSANLKGTNLTRADLGEADLSNAYLSKARFVETILTYTDLTGADFKGTFFNSTVISNCPTLIKSKNLDKIKHQGDSSIDHLTLRACVSELPYIFLQGLGYTNKEIEILKEQYSQPIKYYKCFISYSRKDIKFVEDLHSKIRDANVPTWRDSEDLKIGDKLRDKINEQIRIYDKLLIVLSKNSVKSPWVKYEVETALNREIKENKTLLFPIRLDDSIFDINESWAIDIQSRNIGDFKNWKNHNDYKKSLKRLIKDLKADQK